MEISIAFLGRRTRLKPVPAVILILQNEYNSAEPTRRNRTNFYCSGLTKTPASGSDVTVLPSKIGLPRRKVATALKGNSIPSYGSIPRKYGCLQRVRNDGDDATSPRDRHRGPARSRHCHGRCETTVPGWSAAKVCRVLREVGKTNKRSGSPEHSARDGRGMAKTSRQRRPLTAALARTLLQSSSVGPIHHGCRGESVV